MRRFALRAMVFREFNGTSGTEDPRAKGYISLDGFHPNNTGHQKIADCLHALGYSPLS